jgi:hypothetical protein
MEYLIIFEDGGMKQCDKISADDKIMVSEGCCDIVRKQKYKDSFEKMKSTSDYEEWENVKFAKSESSEVKE